MAIFSIPSGIPSRPHYIAGSTSNTCNIGMIWQGLKISPLFIYEIHKMQKSFKNIVVHDDIYEQLRKRGNITDSFNQVITEVLRHHESAVTIIGECESCKSKFKEAIGKG
jgi:predicted CopG family antitoxin